MNWFPLKRIPDSFRRLSRNERRDVVATIEDFAARKRSTARSLADTLSASSLRQIEDTARAFSVAADVLQAMIGAVPVEFDGELNRIKKQRDRLLDEKVDAEKERRRADGLERQLQGATDEIEELKLRLREIKKTGEDPLDEHLRKVAENASC